MSFSQTLKRLRKGADLTQEQLAERLYVTPQAVSRWETGTSLPELSMIGPIANLFGVSADELLGICIDRNSEAILQILEEDKNLRNAAKFEESAALLLDAHRRYPGSFEIMERLAHALVNVYSRKGLKDYSEVIRLCDTVLDKCTDSAIRRRALETLGSAYSYTGQKDKLAEIAAQMTPFANCRESFLLWDLEGESGLDQRREYLSSLIGELITSLNLLAGHRMDDGRFAYDLDDRITLWKQAVTVIETLYPDGDFQIMAQEGEILASLLAITYLQKGDTEEFLFWLKKEADFAVCFDTYSFDAVHTSPALRGISDGGWIMENGRNHSAAILEAIRAEERISPSVRSDHRFTEILTRLEKTAVTPQNQPGI